MAQIREDLHKRLLAELSSPAGNQKAIAELVTRASAVEVLEKQSASKAKSRWRLPVFIAAIAITLVGIASLIRLPYVPMELDATVSEFQIRLDSARRDVGGMLTFAPGTFVSAAHPKNDPAAARFIGLGDIRLDSSSVISFRSKPGRCYEVYVQAGELHGTLVPIARSDDAVVPSPEQIALKQNELLRFCSTNDSSLYFEGIETLSISTPLRFHPSELHAPSIASGQLRLTITNEQRELTDTDRLLLAGARDSQLALRFGASLRVSFSASVSQPRLFEMTGPASRGDSDLRPTLSNVATSWPPLTALLASVVGLSTALMGAIRWLGLRTQE